MPTPCTPRPSRVCGGVLTPCAPTPPRALGHSDPARPHHPAHWGVSTLCAPTPTRECGSVFTPCPPTPPRTLGRAHTLRAHATPCIGACPHSARPPPPFRVCGGVLTLCAPTPPRVLGRVHTCAPTPTRVCRSVSTHCAPTPPRALGRVHTLRAHAAPRMWERALRAPNRPVHWSIHTLSAHITPRIGAHSVRPTTPRIGACPHPALPLPLSCVCGGVLTPCAPLSVPPLCSRRSPPTRYEKTHAAVRFVGRVRSI